MPARSAPVNRFRLLSQTAAVPLLCSCSECRDDKSFSGMALRTCAHTFTNTYSQSYYVTPAFRRVWHMLMRQPLPLAGSAALSSRAAHRCRNQSHFHLHHLSSSEWWRGVPIICSPTQSAALTLVSNTETPAHTKKKHTLIFQHCIWHLDTWNGWKTDLQGHTVPLIHLRAAVC